MTLASPGAIGSRGGLMTTILGISGSLRQASFNTQLLVFGKRPVAVIGATPGRGGTALAQLAWLPILRTLDTLPYFAARVQVAQAKAAFDANGRLTDERIKGELEKALRGFVEFVRASAPLRAPR